MAEPRPGEQAIFNVARRIEDPEARRHYVEHACGEDRDVQARIEALLRAHDDGSTFLRSPAEEVRAGFADTVREVLGTAIGPYKLLQLLGEGGMGTVFLAEQVQPVQRTVALKLITPGLDSRQVIARFEAERQALALMDHPNIAKVLDAGTTPTGRPYFVMELVKGVPLTRYCDEHRLTLRQRLELFVAVCQGVQHAHQKGIIHRDLKPSNILVTVYDGQPVPKIIDFGVAKATAQKLTERTLVTETGAVVGTVDYMSPEQAAPNQLDIDTRSDLYALGVLLYELLTGTTPLHRERREEVGLWELLRLIREEEPPWPSLRLSTTEELGSVAANRGLEPKRLQELVRSDLDWIVMKCLEKDRTRRYETADGLVRDIERYLRDEPVEASPPGAGYRLRKFVKRNKGRVVAAGLVLAALLAGMAGTTWGMIRAEHARQEAVSAQLAETERAEGERQAKEAAEKAADEERKAKEESLKRLTQIEKGTEILAAVFRDLDPKAAEKEGVTLRVLLGRRLGEAVQQLEGEAVGDPLVVARLQHALGISLRELGYLEQAEVVLVKARQTRERLLGTDNLDTVATKHNLAMLYRHQRKFAQAETLYEEVVEVRAAKLRPDHADTLSSKNNLALVYMDRGKYALAEKLLNEVLEIRTATLEADDPKTLQSKHNLAGLYGEQKKYAAAEKLLREVLEMRHAKLGPKHLDTLQTKNNLAGLYDSQRRYADAEKLYEEVVAVGTAELGHHHPITLQSKKNLVGLYHSQRKYADAEKLLRQVLEVQAATLGLGHPSTLFTRNDLAIVYKDMKKFDQAIPLLEETVQLSKAHLEPDHPDTLLWQANLGVIYRDAGRFADAMALLEEVHRKGRKHARLAWVGDSLRTTYVRAGKTEEMKALVTEQVQAARQQFPADSLELVAALAAAGNALLDAKAYADAEALLRENLSLREQKTPNVWRTHHGRALLGGALLGQEKYSDAEPLLVQGYAGLKGCEAMIPKDARVCLTQALEWLVQLHDARGNKAEAARWRQELEDEKTAQKR